MEQKIYLLGDKNIYKETSQKYNFFICQKTEKLFKIQQILTLTNQN